MYPFFLDMWCLYLLDWSRGHPHLHERGRTHARESMQFLVCKIKVCSMLALQVEILSEGDSINELMILVGGMCEVLKPGLEETSEELSIDIDGHNSIRGGYARQVPQLHQLLSNARE